ncbi:hypothetical protein ARHIZOSPH14_04470 [Agromyces rhizosphaerae]|uniref:Uncharacterized protein n=1 Tax=Agromyces rhizosphaerae TaxID=88374 RepID=A0A9W6FN99_9MICO|nr:hypothetical protein ARHIZOSPH14_04470 [Agromyces rhizosphaerae]
MRARRPPAFVALRGIRSLIPQMLVTNTPVGNGTARDPSNGCALAAENAAFRRVWERAGAGVTWPGAHRAARMMVAANPALAIHPGVPAP